MSVPDGCNTKLPVDIAPAVAFHATRDCLTTGFSALAALVDANHGYVPFTLTAPESTVPAARGEE